MTDQPFAPPDPQRRADGAQPRNHTLSGVTYYRPPGNVQPYTNPQKVAWWAVVLICVGAVVATAVFIFWAVIHALVVVLGALSKAVQRVLWGWRRRD